MLEEQVRVGTRPERLAQWAHGLYLTTRSEDGAVTDALLTLIAMGEGPEFRLEREELAALADTLKAAR
jgi:hypothetical protein